MILESRGENNIMFRTLRKKFRLKMLKERTDKLITISYEFDKKRIAIANMLKDSLDEEVEREFCEKLRKDGFQVGILEMTKTLHEIKISWT